MVGRGLLKHYLKYSVLVTGVLIIGALIHWLVRQRTFSENEYAARVALKNIAEAEISFRDGDIDGNGVPDYWTGDVAGLYRFNLVPESIARADANPLSSVTSVPIPWKGYYFIALDEDRENTPSQPYRTATDRASGKVHSLTSFGFCAYPAGSNFGQSVIIINENKTTFINRGILNPLKYWPSVQERKSNGWFPQ